MNIDEFIEHTKEKAEEYKYRASFFESDNPMNKACIKVAKDHEQLAEWFEKSKEYQQLEEQDRLIKLPCKVGDTLYRLVPNLYREYVEIKIAQFVINKNGIYFITNRGVHWNVNRIGKTVFLTREEAEAKLKGLRGGE
mgnify:CR=1 FL=1